MNSIHPHNSGERAHFTQRKRKHPRRLRNQGKLLKLRDESYLGNPGRLAVESSILAPYWVFLGRWVGLHLSGKKPKKTLSSSYLRESGLENFQLKENFYLFTTRLSVLCKKRRGKKEPPLWTVGEGLYWAVALGQNSRGRVSKETKGVCEVRGVRRGFIARAGFPYKEESAGFSGV